MFGKRKMHKHTRTNNDYAYPELKTKTSRPPVDTSNRQQSNDY